MKEEVRRKNETATSIYRIFRHPSVENHNKIHIKNDPFALHYAGKVIANSYLEVIALTKEFIPQEIIENRIFIIRGQKVMLDIDLATLYQVKLKRLNEQVRRNSRRFPDDFMFQLSAEEFEGLRSHFATAKYSMRRFLPYAFTEQGVAMFQ